MVHDVILSLSFTTYKTFCLNVKLVPLVLSCFYSVVLKKLPSGYRCGGPCIPAHRTRITTPKRKCVCEDSDIHICGWRRTDTDRKKTKITGDFPERFVLGDFPERFVLKFSYYEIFLFLLKVQRLLNKHLETPIMFNMSV